MWNCLKDFTETKVKHKFHIIKYQPVLLCEKFICFIFAYILFSHSIFIFNRSFFLWLVTFYLSITRRKCFSNCNCNCCIGRIGTMCHFNWILAFLNFYKTIMNAETFDLYIFFSVKKLKKKSKCIKSTNPMHHDITILFTWLFVFITITISIYYIAKSICFK